MEKSYLLMNSLRDSQISTLLNIQIAFSPVKLNYHYERRSRNLKSDSELHSNTLTIQHHWV